MSAQANQEKQDALTWLNESEQTGKDKSTWEWLWESIQGDFNDQRSTGQITFDAAVSMVPVIDQICDVRDLIANCKKINQDRDDTWAWVALCLTLIGLFPTLGSLVKGVLKIFFMFVRRMGLDHLIKAVDVAMTWVITFLRKREVQHYLRALQVDEVFKWLAKGVREVAAAVNVQTLKTAFDKGIRVLEGLAKKAEWVPSLGARIKTAVDQVKSVRKIADDYLARALDPVQKILDHIIKRLEYEHLLQRQAVVNANNVHFVGALPEASAVSLMRRQNPPPAWLSKGVGKHPALNPALPKTKKLLADNPTHPKLSEDTIRTFHNMVADEIKGPAKLYRIIAPNSRAMSESWVSEEVFQQLKNAPDPRLAWRKYLAVWPHWNVNGQFAVYEVKAGETLKVWRGPASSQTLDQGLLDGYHLEGGWEQVVFNIERTDARNDTMRYYKHGGGNGTRLQRPVNEAEFKNLPPDLKKEYTAYREKINHSNIRAPFETGWGYTDFNEQALNGKIGLPELPGQVTNR